jgi:LysR family cyn operon transcriptional activator
MEELLNDELDIGIAFDDVHSADIDVLPLLKESLALMVSESHPLAQQECVALSHLNNERLILLSENLRRANKLIMPPKDLHPQIVIEANSINAILELVRRTTLATLLPSPIAAQNGD